MKHALIRHQEIGTTFSGVYYVESSYVKQTVQKKDYTDFTLRDKSGSRNVKYWGRVDGVNKGDYAFISANVDDYQGNASVVAKNVEKSDVPDDLSNYIPEYDEEGTLDYAERFEQLKQRILDCEVKTGNSTASTLVNEVFSNSSFFEKFVTGPGDVKPHYGKQGGLLANIVRVAETALSGENASRLTDKELIVLITSALLYKVGAAYAYDFVDCVPKATNRGELLGVGFLSVDRISPALRRTISGLTKAGKEVDGELVLRIMHSVISNSNGGVVPMTKEAILLNASISLDYDIIHAMGFIDDDTNTSEEFTAYDPEMYRRYYTGVRA